jgi:hypothetical protein
MDGHLLYWVCDDPYEEDPSCPDCGNEWCIPTTDKPVVGPHRQAHVRHCKVVCGLCADDTTDCPACGLKEKPTP